MPRPYTGPKLWLDPKRGTWTITDGRRRVRTGYAERQRDLAVIAIHQYSNGTYSPERPEGPRRTYAVPPRRGVYVIGFGPYVKIGITENLDQRISNLQTPEPVELLALFEGANATYEKILHCRFSKLRLNGEWFKREGELADWLYRGCPADVRAA